MGHPHRFQIKIASVELCVRRFKRLCYLPANRPNQEFVSYRYTAADVALWPVADIQFDAHNVG